MRTDTDGHGHLPTLTLEALNAVARTKPERRGERRLLLVRPEPSVEKVEFVHNVAFEAVRFRDPVHGERLRWKLLSKVEILI